MLITALMSSKYDGDLLEYPTLYKTFVGALQYYTMIKLQAMKYLLWYLKGTPSHGIMIHKSNAFDIFSYIDADWASSYYDRRIIMNIAYIL